MVVNMSRFDSQHVVINKKNEIEKLRLGVLNLANKLLRMIKEKRERSGQ